MDDTNPALFIDTNCFLHMKDFNQIDWRKLFPKAEAIALVVCQAVISELDKHKVSTNRRRKDRARKALNLIEQASEAPDMALLIRENADAEFDHLAGKAGVGGFSRPRSHERR